MMVKPEMEMKAKTKNMVRKSPLAFLRTYGSWITWATYECAIRKFLASALPESFEEVGNICATASGGISIMPRSGLTMDSIALQYFETPRDYESDVEAFLSALTVSGSLPKTVRHRIAVAKVLLEENGIDLSERF